MALIPCLPLMMTREHNGLVGDTEGDCEGWVVGIALNDHLGISVHCPKGKLQFSPVIKISYNPQT